MTDEIKLRCNRCEKTIPEFIDKALLLCDKCAICELCKKHRVKVFTEEGYYVCDKCYKKLRISQRSVKKVDIGF